MAQIKRRFVVGIDPGVKTGIALYDRELKEIIDVRTAGFWDCYDFVRQGQLPENSIIIVETPVKNAMYAHQEMKAYQGTLKRSNAMMSSVASNAREGELLAEGFERLGYEVRRVRPHRRNFKTAAEDVEYVRRYTGYVGKTNPHTRDAIMLCWGI